MGIRRRIRAGKAEGSVTVPGTIVLSSARINPNAAQGTVVGTYTVVGGGSFTNAAINNTDFQLSATSGTSIQLQRSGTGSLTAGGSESVTMSADGLTSLASTISVDTLPTLISLSASSIVENASSGTVIGVLSTTGGRSGYTYSIQSNTKFAISGTDLTRSATGSLTGGVGENVTVRVTDANSNTHDEIFAITVTTVASGQLITTFSVSEWNSASSTGFLRFGLPFKQGDIPSGSIPEIRLGGTPLTAVQFDERVTWSDGSLAFCVCHANLSSFTSAQTKDYEIYRVTGSYSNTGTKALTDITGTHDFKVLFSSFQQYDGSTSTQRGSGAFTASFNTQAAVATRCWKYHSGPVCESWEVWGPALDDTGGAADAHLTTVWYVSIWKNTNGTIADYEYCAVPSQFWWSVASKYRLDYTATLKNGGSTIQTYTGVQHPYRAQWATVRTTVDNNHARRHWVTAIPTLMYKPSKSYWVQTGYIPPYDTNFTPNASAYSTPYVPGDDIDHGTSINSTGPYQGRGLLNNSDLRFWMRLPSSATAQDLRYARTNAFMALHLPYHYRSNRTRTRPASDGCPGGDASPDTAATIIAMKLDPLAPADFTADGMPVSVDASANSDSNAIYKDSYVTPLGGVGVFGASNVGGGDSSHARRPAFFMYLMEGERFFMQAHLSLATKAAHGIAAVHPNYRATPGGSLSQKSSYQANFTFPSNYYHGVAEFGYHGNTRHLGWSSQLLAIAWAVCPDNDPQRNFIRAWVTHNYDYYAQTVNYMPANQLALGTLEAGTDQFWQIAMNAQCHYHAYALTKLQDILDMGNFAVKAAISLCATNRYRCIISGFLTSPKSTTMWDPVTNDFFTAAQLMRTDITTTSINPTTDVLTFISTSWSYTNGDQCRPVIGAVSVNDRAVPSELTEGELLYLVNVSGSTAQVSRTPGGAAINFTNSYTITNWAFLQQEFGNYSVAVNPPYLPSADSNASMVQAAINYGSYLGNTDCDAQVSNINTFMQNVSTSDWVTWRLRASP